MLDDPLLKMIAIHGDDLLDPVVSGHLPGDTAWVPHGACGCTGTRSDRIDRHLGGFAGPFLIGLIREATQNFTMSLLAVSAILSIRALVMLALGDPASHKSTAQG